MRINSVTSQYNPQITYIQSDGNAIALSVWKRHESAVTVLFYPGTMASPLLYPILLDELWRLGCNVVGVHPLGHGLSPRVHKAFTFDDILQNGVDTESWIYSNFSGPVVVTGHSQGGILTLAHATQSRNLSATFPICTLLPQDSMAGSVTRFHKILHHREALLEGLGMAARMFPRLPLPFFMYLELARITAGAYRLVAPRTSTRLTYPLKFINSLFTKDLSAACTPGNITCPVTLITACDDTLFPLSYMRDTLDKICCPRKKLIVLNGGGHMAAMSFVYAKHIAAYVAAHCSGFGLPLYATRNMTSR